MKDVSNVDPALLYFCHKYFPNDVDQGVVDDMVSKLIPKVEKTRQIRPIRPLPTSRFSSGSAPKSERDKKTIVLSGLRCLLFDARGLNVLQEKSARHNNISFRQLLAPEPERSDDGSTTPAQNDGSNASEQELPSEAKAQAPPASNAAETPTVDDKSEPKPSSGPETDNSKPSPGTTASGSQAHQSKEASIPSPAVQNSNNDPALKSEINGTPKPQPEPASKPIQQSATDVKAGSDVKPPPAATTTAKADRPKEVPTTAVPDDVVKGEVNGSKTRSQSGESSAAAANLPNKDQPKERSAQSELKPGEEAKARSQPAPKPAESSNASVKPKVEPDSEASGSTSKPAPAASTSKTTEAAAGGSRRTATLDEKIRTSKEDNAEKPTEEITASSKYAKERSRFAQDGRGRTVPKPAVISDPAPEIKQEPKREEKTESKPTAGSSSSSAKVNPTPPLKEEKKPAHGETNGSSPSTSSSGKGRKSSSAAVNAAFEELRKSTSASASRQSDTKAKSPPSPQQPSPPPQSKPQPEVKPEPKPQPPPRTEPEPPKPSPSFPPPRTDYARPKPSPPSPPPSRAQRTAPKPTYDYEDRYEDRYYKSYHIGGSVQCSGITLKGVRCRNWVKITYRPNFNSRIEPKLFCHWHGEKEGSDIPISMDPSAMTTERCSAITQLGTLCRRDAEHFRSSKYGYCTQHAQIKGWIY